MMLLVSSAMAATTTATTAADATTNFTITVNLNAADKGTHTYSAYRIFKGDLVVTTDDSTNPATVTKVLSNIEWDTTFVNTSATDFYTKINAAVGTTGTPTAREVAEKLTDANADAFAKAIDSFLKGSPANSDEVTYTAGTTTSASITVAGPGYYLVKDVLKENTEQSASLTKFMLEVVSDVTVTAKSSVPTVDKKVKDINDSTEDSATDWQKSADYDVGDYIPYQITATVGDGIVNYDSYSIKFVDTMSKGLTFFNAKASDDANHGWKVMIGTEDVTESFTLTSAAVSSGDYNGGNAYTWACNDIKGIATSATDYGDAKIAINADTTVVLTYWAQLNTDAVRGTAGNPNTVTLQYDNNPNDSGKGTPGGSTPPSTSIVFTYDVVTDKVNGSDAALHGALFSLYKTNKDSSKTYYPVALTIGGTEYVFSFGDSGVTTIAYTEESTEKTFTVASNDGFVFKDASNQTLDLSASTATSFKFLGLDDGTYTLTEVITPKGYNTASPITFQVVPTHDATKGDSTSLTAINVKDSTGKVIDATAENNVDKIFKVELTNTKAEVETKVVNESGATLPSTGGIGTTIFYVAGSILVLAAAILLITKRRMGVND